MASRHKKPARKTGESSVAGLRGEAEDLIAKGRFKEAVKQAKICYKEEATPEYHRLLERAYLLRADQLRRGGMPTAAREVAQHLLDFGVTGPDLAEEAARLLLALGMSRDASALLGRLDSPEAKERLARDAADQAVLQPGHAWGAPPELLDGARRVREALEAVQAGDEPRAIDLLRDVPRSSPLADWKLFVRGLAAASRRDDAEVAANWDRLDPRRVAARIARVLRALSGPSPDAPATSGPRLETLEARVFGEPVLGLIEELRTVLAEDRWEQAILRIAPLRIRLGRIDPRLAERLTEVLYTPLVRYATGLGYHKAQRLIQDFIRAAQPLPIDPRWNRLWALAWEGPQGSVEDAEDYWRAYLKDLETLPALSADERVLARALVLKHLGHEYVHEADAVSGPQRPSPTPEAKDLREQAVERFEQSLRLAPSHRATYRALFDAYRDWEQPEAAAEVARRLLKRFPDDFDAALFLAGHHFGRDEPAEALGYALRARALRPLDPSAASEEWAARVGLARHLALKKRWDEGRAELEAAGRACPEYSRGVHFDARRAVFELKAGERDRAEALIAEALGRLPEPAPLWLALRIEAARYKLPKADKDRFEARWASAHAKRVRSETAGALANLLAPFVGGDVDYPGRAGHVKQVVDYLRRSSRTKYRPEDLRRVCTFLALLPKERILYEAMVKKGMKLAPGAAVFLAMAGHIELGKGPFGGSPWLARSHFEKALERARASSDPDDARLIPQIQQSLSMLKDLTGSPMGLPFGGFGGGGPASLFEALGELMGMDPDDFDDFDDDDDDEWDPDWDDPPPRRPPPSRGGGAGRGRGRKKG